MKYRTSKIADKRAIAPIIAIVVIAVVIIAAVFITQIEWFNDSPIKMQTFEVNPSEFSVSSSGVLTIKLENLVSTDATNVVIKLETHDNVQVYQGNSLLPKESGYYTLNKDLSPSELSELKLNLKGTIEVGDNTRDYYVTAYCFVSGTQYCSSTDTFKVTRS